MAKSLAGSRLGKYEIQAELGRGGMGVVYLGRDPLLERKVAIKVLAPHLVWEEGFVERFLREARSAAKIKHPNIVTIYDVGQEGEYFYFVMEYLEGRTLTEIIRQRGPLPAEEVLSILRPLADALDQAHEQGLVHRDIKPANIVVGPSGHVTLTDFGIARAAQEARLTSTGTIMGTPEYMSPEQAWGEEVDCRTDLYSLAVVAYEMLSGKAPFSGTTPHAVLYKQIHEPPPSIQQARPDLLAGVGTVLDKALAKERDKRYPTAQGFVSALEQALAGEKVAPPAEAATQVSKRERAPAEAAIQMSTRESVPAARPPSVTPRPTPPSTSAPTPKAEPAAKPAHARRGVPRLAWVLVGLVVLVLVAMGVLIALSGTGTSTPTPTSQAPIASQPTLTPSPVPTARPAPTKIPAAPQLECPDPVVCVEVRKGEPVRIGYILVLSGLDSALGIDAQRGIEIAASEKREILGHPIELVGQDSKCNAEGGAVAAAKMAPDPKVVGIIGTSCSSAAKTAAPTICDANKPLISPSNTSPELTNPGRPPTLRCYLRTAPNDRWQGEVMARFAWDAGYRKAATCHDGTTYSQQLVEVFVEQFKRLGGEVTAQETVGPNDTDVRPMLTRVVDSGAQFFYYPVFVDRGSLITRQAKEVQGMEKVRLAGAEAMFTIDFLKAAGEAAVGLVLTSPDVTAYGDRYLVFRKFYEDRYGALPIGPYHAHAYDAAMLMFEAVARTGKLDDAGTLYIGRQALLDALFATQDFDGVTGKLTCNPFGDCADPKIAVYEIVNADTGTWNPGPEGNPRRIWP